MSGSLINLIALVGPLLILAAYWFFFIYWGKREGGQERLNLTERLGKDFTLPEKETEALSLLKSDAIPDAYFKSTIPKVEGLREWIQHAGLDIRPTTFIVTSITIGIVIGFSFFLVLKANYLLSFIIGAACCFILPWVFITFFTHLMKKKFLTEFPIALDMMRRALRAGHSVDRALNMIAEQMTGSTGEVFRTIVDKMRLGEPIETVLTNMANRLGIEDFRMLAIVMVLQRETGGSLAEAAENFSKIIRTREYMRKKTKALSAEVRVTAGILIAIPFLILGAVYTVSPAYLDPLFKTEQGRILLLIGGGMLIAGITIIVRMVYKENY